MRKIHSGELLFHTSTFLFFLYAHQLDLGPVPTRLTYAGEYKFYTFWNVTLAVVYYGLASIVDFKHLVVSHDFRSARKMRDYVFCSLVIPASMTVCVTFWCIYLADPDLIMPASMQKFIPVHGFYNHAVHTVPVIATIMEISLVFHVPSSRFSVGVLGGIVYGTCYALWVHYIAFMPDGFWAYPFLEVFSEMQRIMFFLVSYAFGFGLYYVGVRMIKAIWHKELELVSSQPKKTN